MISESSAGDDERRVEIICAIAIMALAVPDIHIAVKALSVGSRRYGDILCLRLVSVVENDIVILRQVDYNFINGLIKFVLTDCRHFLSWPGTVLLAVRAAPRI
mgnify:CR=1 FL=1